MVPAMRFMTDVSLRIYVLADHLHLAANKFLTRLLAPCPPHQKCTGSFLIRKVQKCVSVDAVKLNNI